MKINFLRFFLLFSCSTPLIAQIRTEDKGSYKKNFTEGTLLQSEGNNIMALDYFLYAYKYDSTTANINYLIGNAYINHPNKKFLAEKYLEKAILDVTKNYEEMEPAIKAAPYKAYFDLGRAYHLDYKFDQAEKMFTTYETYLKAKDKLGKEEVAYWKERIKYARKFYSSPIKVQIENMGDSINDAMPDFSPVLSADERTMIFTHRGKNNVGGGELALDGFPFEDIMIAYKRDDGHWSTPNSISPYINTSGNEGSVGLTPDGQTLLIYKDDNGDGNLYFSNWDGKDWSLPTKFGSNINTPSWEPSACLSRDGNILYFVSDRPGGLGGRDIWKCVKLPTGNWSLASNLGPTINTPYDEESPFLSPDGVTFYFSSKGHHSMGGFDIMFSIIGEDGKFSPPINMEYPINTTDDDLYLVASPDNKRLYYSSAHVGGFGEKDIYKITYESGITNPLALFKGQIKPGPCDSLPDDISIVVTNKVSGEMVGTYRPQHKTGTFSVIIPPGSKYIFSYVQGGNEIFKEEITVSEDITYEEIHKPLNLKAHNLCQGAIMDYDSTKSNDVLLQLTILNNIKEKKGVPKFPFQILTADGIYYEGLTEADGTIKDILLEKNTDYDIVVSVDPKHPIKTHFSTKGISGGKKIEKTIFTVKSAVSEVNISLNVLVLNNKKSKKPVPNAVVRVSGTDGSKLELTTDAKGKVSNIDLAQETNYELVAEADGKKSAAGVVSTQGLRKTKVLSKTLYVSGEADVVEVPDNSEVSGTNFKFYFKYNMNEIDVTAAEYVQFISNLVTTKKPGEKIKLKILASASKVPTSTYKNNSELSDMRAKNTLAKVKQSLLAKGFTETDFEIIQEKSIISGPDYKGDYQKNQSTYEKYQYVSVQAF